MTPLEARTLAAQILHRCHELAQITDTPGQIDRPFLSPATAQVHALIQKWMTQAGLTVRTDAVGNLLGRLEGGNPSTVLWGSHIDTVPNAGAFDGILGVLTGISLAEHLNKTGQTLHHSLEIVAFSEEEGVRFGFPFIGSRALVGTLTPEDLELQDANGISVARAIADFGISQPLSSAIYPHPVLAYLELHIEQGPVLEHEDLSVGVVSGIMGQSRLAFDVVGQANHAGTTPLHLRRNALVGAAQMVLDADRLALKVPGLVATVGQFEVFPGASNVIPGRVKLSLDVRHLEDKVREKAVQTFLTKAFKQVSKCNLIGMGIVRLLDQSAKLCDPTLVSAWEKALEAQGLPAFTLPSGAGHDAMILADHYPSSMLFVRSPGGLSHHPSEAVRLEDLERAVLASRGILLGLLEN
jgi:allantoate deiminase